MKVVITLPAYNEEKTLGGVLDSIKKVMDGTAYTYQILVVDDGSKDRTAHIAKQHGAVVVSHPRNYGLAEAFRTEMEHCLRLGADIIVHTDADGQYRAQEIPGLIKKVEQGYDFVMGSRFMGHIESMPLLKRLGNKAFSKVLSHITKTKITDGQTGFRAFTREVAEKVSISSTHTYTQEQIIRVVRQKFKLLEVPAYFAKRGGDTTSRLMKNPFDYAIKAWITLFRVYRDYEPLKFFGFIGGLFFTVGVLIGLFVLWNILTTGIAGGIPRVILSALLILSGIQVWLFGFLADMHKK